MPVGAVGDNYANYARYANNPAQTRAQPQAPPVQPPKDEKDYDNGHDYWVDTAKYELSKAQSPADVHRIASDMFSKMEDNKKMDGGEMDHHIQEKANDHEHSRTRKDMKQAVAAALQRFGLPPGPYDPSQDDLGNERDK